MESFIDLGPTVGWIIGWSVTGALVAIALLALLGLLLDWNITKLVSGKFVAKDQARYDREIAQYHLDVAAHDEKYKGKKGDSDEEYWSRPQRPQNVSDGPFRRRRNRDGFGAWIVVAVMAGFFAVAIGGVQAIMMNPYDSKYWSWFSVSGNVTEVQGTLDVSSEYVVSEFLVTLDSTDIPLHMTDTRIQALAGEDVELLCGVSWMNFGNSADQWNCEIRSAEYTK